MDFDILFLENEQPTLTLLFLKKKHPITSTNLPWFEKLWEKTQKKSLKVTYRIHTTRLGMLPIVIKVVYFDGFTLFVLA
jgi:hypothetical protein